MFLSREDIKNLTEYKLPNFQIKWLEKNGYKFAVGKDGHPRVLHSHIEAMLGGDKLKKIRTQPNEAALLAYQGSSDAS